MAKIKTKKGTETVKGDRKNKKIDRFFSWVFIVVMAWVIIDSSWTGIGKTNPAFVWTLKDAIMSSLMTTSLMVVGAVIYSGFRE